MKVFGSAGHRPFHLSAASLWLQPCAKRKAQRALTRYCRLKASATSDQVFPCSRRLSESRSCSCLMLRICPGMVLPLVASCKSGLDQAYPTECPR